MASHPDRRFVSYICTGLRDRFRIGFDRSHVLKRASANMFSALQYPEVIQDYISNELQMGRMLGSLDAIYHPTIHINRYGDIPKGHSHEKWCFITDLSYPPGNSVNNGIDPKLCSLQSTSIDDVAGQQQSLTRIR